jgi:hypothetical protein
MDIVDEDGHAAGDLAVARRVADHLRVVEKRVISAQQRALLQGM